eukprot:scaffold168299_cov19-Tisochrysis_lutea.AAC.1
MPCSFTPTLWRRLMDTTPASEAGMLEIACKGIAGFQVLWQERADAKRGTWFSSQLQQTQLPVLSGSIISMDRISGLLFMQRDGRGALLDALILVQIVTDPRTDHQPVKEAAYMGIPCIAFADTDRCGVCVCESVSECV